MRLLYELDVFILRLLSIVASIYGISVTKILPAYIKNHLDLKRKSHTQVLLIDLFFNCPRRV